MMNTTVRNALGVALVIAVLLGGYAAIAYVRAYGRSIDPSSLRSFTVSADAKEVAVPDIAQFTFSVITEGGTNLAKLQTDNTNKVNAIIDFVKSKNVDAKDIRTSYFNLSPRYQGYACASPPYDPYGRPVPTQPCPPPDIVGYTINQTVEVRVRKFEDLGNLLSGVIEKGANSVSQLNFTVDDPTNIQNRAREKAITKAREKAELVAKAGGFSVGRLISIDENQYPYQPYPQQLYAEKGGIGGGGDVTAVPPTIEPGSQEVYVSVFLRFEIE